MSRAGSNTPMQKANAPTAIVISPVFSNWFMWCISSLMTIPVVYGECVGKSLHVNLCGVCWRAAQCASIAKPYNWSYSDFWCTGR